MNFFHHFVDKLETAFLIPNWMAAVFLSIVAWTTWHSLTQAAAQERLKQGKIAELENKAEREPEKVRFAWDLARVKLESYFDRNLAQVKAIFAVAIMVMAAGFAFIMWGLNAAITNPDRVKVALIASVSGVITQFIGLTFMVIYRSTMLQATQFMSVLDRINNVGMAVQILDAMKDEAGDLKDNTRVDIIRLLLATPSARMSFTPRARKEKHQKGDSFV
jgi:hypothetical protein